MSIEFLDLTDLQRRGLLRKAEELARISRDGPEVLDLTDARTVQALNNTSTPKILGMQTPAADSPLDFLSDFAQIGAQNTSSENSTNTTLPAMHASTLEPKLDTILAKLEDTMFKIELLSSRLAQLEARLNN
ncbi:MAG TPA: hypothetical protein VJK07_01105 [Candidatus Nanoarchaeia archaeon]|nr:hypothetical protein [Candidatus Nanoarchaeia archaeon]